VGSDARELAVGQDELRALLTSLFDQPSTVRWEGSDLTVGDAAGAVWFLLVGELVLSGPPEQRLPYRLSCVCVPQGDAYRVVQLHGSRPAAG
jgi:hypothetical protein